MKKVLITGANSYIGEAFRLHLSSFPDQYQVDTMDMVDGLWRDKSFKAYDCVFHVAGIAHQDSGRISKKQAELYYDVNYKLAVEAASKAKKEGVSQFILMSTMSVYGQRGNITKMIAITRDTVPNPQNAYGNSKLLAEEGVLSLHDGSFHVCILRPPMIYGHGCKGNYPLLQKAALKLPLFPNIPNKRSMLYIENLCHYVKMVIDENMTGIHFPQNSEYVCTSEMVREIARAHDRNIRMVKLFNPLLRLLSGKLGIVDRVFGSLIYDIPVLNDINYNEVSFADSVLRTENVRYHG